MAYTAAGLNGAVSGIAGVGTRISLHTADPGLTGASEVTGGSYARQTTTWGAPTNGVSAGSQVSVPVPAGTSVTHWGIWTAATGGSFVYGGALGATETFGAAGTLQHTPTLTVTN